MFRLPDWLSFEIGHTRERLQERYARLHVKNSINDHPGTVAVVAFSSLLLMAVALWLFLRPAPPQPREWGKKAWFYDQNTGHLFVADSKETGPVKAPSGPLPDGEPAGLRAHVYSYVLDPNEAERFVGFLEKPEPGAEAKSLATMREDFDAWVRGRLVKRIEDETWVPAGSRQGREILEALGRPNERGQTPVYHVPR